MTSLLLSTFLIANVLFLAFLLLQSKKRTYHSLSGMHIIIVPLVYIVLEAYYVSCCFVATKADYKILLIACTLLYFIFPCLLMYYLVPKMEPFKTHETLGGVIGALYGRKAHIFTTVSSVIAMLLMLMVLLAGVGATAAAVGLHPLFTIVGIGTLGTVYARYSSMRKIKAAILLSFVMFIGVSGWWTSQALIQYKGIKNIFYKMIHQVTKEDIDYCGVLSPYKMFFFIVLQFCLTLLAFSAPTVIPTILAMYSNKQKTANKINNIAIFYPLMRLLILMSLFGFFLADIPFSFDFLDRLAKCVTQFSNSGHSITLILLFSCLLMVTTAFFIALIHALERTVNIDIQQLTGEVRPFAYKIPYMTFLLGLVAMVGAWTLSHFPGTMVPVLCLAFTVATACTLPFFLGVLTLKGHKKAFFVNVGSLFGSIIMAIFLRPYFTTVAMWDYLGYSFSLAIIVSSLCLLMTYYLLPKSRMEPDIVDVPDSYMMMERGKPFKHAWARLSRWATSQMRISPYEPRVLGGLLVVIHIFVALKLIGKANLPASLMVVNTIGLILANILVWHAHFPHRIKRFFPYYWLFSLFYCLPFNGILSFLFQPESTSVLLQALFGILVLGFFVDRITFLMLTGLGVVCALGVYYLQCDQLYQGFTFMLVWKISLGLTYTAMLSLIFNNRRNYRRQKDALVKNKIVATVFSQFLQNQLSTMPAKELKHILHRKRINHGEDKGKVELRMKDYENLIIYSSDIMHLVNVCKTQLTILEDMLYYDHITADQIVRRNMGNLMQGAHHRLLLIYKNRVKLLDESTDFSIYVFPALFHHAIANIVENAFWYGDAREMTIWWSAKKRTLYFQDNGLEIPDYLRASLFEPIQEPDQRIAGLRFVKMVVDLLGAEISFISNKKGTRFAIQFPPVDES